MKYKIWVHIEEIDEEADHYKDFGSPQSLAEFDNSDDALEFRDSILDRLALTE